MWWPRRSNNATALLLVAALVGVGLIGAAEASGASEAPRSAIVRLADDAPPVPANATVAASTTADSTQQLTLTLTLERTDEAGFEHALADIDNPRSPQYRHFLTQAQLADRFGPSESEYDSVLSWLRSQGFTLVQGSTNRLTITVRGTRAEAEQAFHVSIGSYRIGSRLVYASDAAPALPAAIAPFVQDVSGLSDLGEPARAPASPAASPSPNIAITFTVCGAAKQGGSPSALATSLIGAIAKTFLGIAVAFYKLSPWLLFACGAMITAIGFAGVTCTFWGWSDGTVWSTVPECIDLANHGLGPSMAPLKPAGAVAAAPPRPQKIGLLEFDTFRPSDVADWLAAAGSVPPSAATLSRLTEVAVNGGVATPGPGEAETLLDVNTSMLLAGEPGTGITVYEAPPSTSFQQMFNAMVSDGDTVISNSWSACEDQVSQASAESIDSVLQSAAAGGVSVFNATGDNGTTCLDGSPNTIGVPADSPNATAVGGSSPTPTAALTYGTETYWDGSANTPPSGKGGYGVSRYFSVPSYQNGLAVGGRSVPDVVADADPSEGMRICQADAGGCPTGGLYGGTSMAAPEWAALTADLNTALGRDLGDVNTALYPIAGSSGFHSAASMGSDFAHVGLGSPDLANLILALSGSALTSVDPSVSIATAGGPDQDGSAPADGTTAAIVAVQLLDTHGFPLAAKAVTVTPNVGSSAVVSAPSGPSDADGIVRFTVTDSTIETATFTVKDTTDNVTLAVHPTMSFVEPTAAGASISTDATNVANTGVASAHITVHLADSLGRPSPGKTVSLSQTGSAALAPGTSTPTDASGNAVFTATDTTAQTVTFTATDVTDGNLPVPGSVNVDFAPFTCGGYDPTAAPGYAVTTFATGFEDPTFCNGVQGMAFDGSGHFDAVNYGGNVYQLPAAGGAAGAGNSVGDQVAGMAVDATGNVFVARQETTGIGNFSTGDIVQINPATGSVIKEVATGIFCPTGMAIDPGGTNLFYTQACGNAGNYVQEIVSPATCASPCTPTAYVQNLPFAIDPITFGPDGTLYAGGGGNADVLAISATKVVTEIPTPAPVQGLAVPRGGSPGGVYAALNNHTIDRIDLSSPYTASPLTAGDANQSHYMVFGPDGCLYASERDTVIRVTSSDGTCGTLASPLSLTAAATTVPTGSSATVTATLSGQGSRAGIPVYFTVTGPNAGLAVSNTDANGAATFTYTGALTGQDTVVASAVINGAAVLSPPLRVTWSAGRDVTFLTMNLSQEEGAVGSPATFTVTLVDISQVPAVPVVGAPVNVSLGDPIACPAPIVTDASGSGSCVVTPTASGLFAVTATYAGNGADAPASATSSFFAGGPSTAAPPGGGGGGGGASASRAAAITRVAGSDRVATAIAASQTAFPGQGSARAVVLARADDFPDALAGVPLAVKLGAPVLLSAPDRLDPAVLAEVQRVLAPGGIVVLLGGTAALSDAVAQALTTAGYHVTRYGGSDRYATAAIIASQGLNDPPVIFETSGQDFADAVSAAPAAASAGGAILLTAGPAQSAATSAYEAAHAGDRRITVGGPAATADPQAATSIVGNDRYQTSELVAAAYFPSPKIAGIATGAAFADALTGGAVLAQAGGPLLLTDPRNLSAAVAAYLTAQKSNIATVDLFGGSVAVSDAVVAEIQSALT